MLTRTATAGLGQQQAFQKCTGVTHAGPTLRPGAVPGTRLRRQPSSSARPVYSTRLHASSAGSLASYSDLLLPSRPSTAWFEDTVRDIVQHIELAPFLEVSYQRPWPMYKRVPVTDSIIATPQLWQDVANTNGLLQPEALVLVHPVSSAEDACILNRTVYRDGSQSSCGGATTSDAAAAATATRSDAPLAQLASRGVRLLSGQVGDCCDGEDASTSHAHEHPRSDSSHHQQPRSPPTNSHAAAPLHQQQQQRQPAHDSGAALGASLCTQYFGLVVQQRDPSAGTQGCYLLKVSRNTDVTGCRCAHYTVTRVCKGQPLHQQWRDSWLA